MECFFELPTCTWMEKIIQHHKHHFGRVMIREAGATVLIGYGLCWPHLMHFKCLCPYSLK